MPSLLMLSAQKIVKHIRYQGCYYGEKMSDTIFGRLEIPRILIPLLVEHYEIQGIV